MENKIILFCSEKYCDRFIEKEWNGEFIENWFCERHRNKNDSE